MNKEFLKMQKLAGLITENQFRQLNENQISWEEFKQKPYEDKLKYLLDKKQDLFSDIDDNKFIDKIITLPSLADRITHGDLINPDILKRNKNKFNKQQQSSIDINLR